ncbi:unnamed protein product [Fusarium venenatum]|uniref:Uncharacterized protein n=1 Tax=Fusarium venenatum TaxID=56646 RepID=A0A2L2TE53_9HYPO|nr:uncharacterized protein FVRRES_02825 [Fusarium venenatum]CEI66313.1 unnamed protein product [Fusarium venenatum]
MAWPIQITDLNHRTGDNAEYGIIQKTPYSGTNSLRQVERSSDEAWDKTLVISNLSSDPCLILVFLGGIQNEQ